MQRPRLLRNTPRLRTQMVIGVIVVTLLLIGLTYALLALRRPATTLERVAIYDFADTTLAVVVTRVHPCASTTISPPVRDGTTIRLTATTHWQSSIFIDRNGQSVPLPVPLCVALRALEPAQVLQPTTELERTLPPGNYVLEVNGQPYPFRVR